MVVVLSNIILSKIICTLPFSRRSLENIVRFINNIFALSIRYGRYGFSVYLTPCGDHTSYLERYCWCLRIVFTIQVPLTSRKTLNQILVVPSLEKSSVMLSPYYYIIIHNIYCYTWVKENTSAVREKNKIKYSF